MRSQTKLRVDTLLGLIDHFGRDDGVPRLGLEPLLGTPVILPSSFGGSPRELQQAFLDATALVAHFGRPDFFVTMTASPSWPEVLHL